MCFLKLIISGFILEIVLFIFTGILVAYMFFFIYSKNFFEIMKCSTTTPCDIAAAVSSEDESAGQRMQQARETAQQSFQLQVLRDITIMILIISLY